MFFRNGHYKLLLLKRRTVTANNFGLLLFTALDSLFLFRNILFCYFLMYHILYYTMLVSEKSVFYTTSVLILGEAVGRCAKGWLLSDNVGVQAVPVSGCFGIDASVPLGRLD